MNIHHRHTIHVCSACSCCTTPCGTKQLEPEEPRPRFSILEALSNLARLAAMFSVLHFTRDRSGTQTEIEQAPAEAIVRPTATEPPSADALLALFAQAAREREHRLSTDGDHHAPPTTEVKPPLSPLAAAFIAALRDEPDLA